MNRPCLAICFVLACLPAALLHAATPEQIDNAIDTAQQEIYTRQFTGNWENAQALNQEQKTGLTALAIYALLASGESSQDIRIDQALRYLETTPTTGVYALGMRCQVWLNMPEPLRKDIRDALERDAAQLLKASHPDSTLHVPTSFFRYSVDSKDWDHSASQYGVLGLWAAAQAGVELPQSFWKGVDAGWRAHQFSDGSWGYETAGPKLPPPEPQAAAGALAPDVFGLTQEKGPRPSMTAAGIATLFISQQYLHGMDGINCTGNIVDKNIDAAMDWMAKHLAESYERNVPAYTLYGIERIGAASGYKYFGTTDWYKDGAEYLVNHPPKDLSDICFSLIFLVRGRAPVVMNKLQYDIFMHGDTPKPGHWNERPRDVANIATWIGKQNEKFLNWQIVNFKSPRSDFHDAPVLYLAGNQPIDFSDDEMALLRQYIEDGGLLFLNADCQTPVFTTAAQKIGKALFPAYEFRNLPESSPIFTNEQFKRVGNKPLPTVQAMSNGARELILLEAADDPGRYWQTQTIGGHENLHQLIDNVFLYAIDRGSKGGLRNRAPIYLVDADPNVEVKGAVKFARLQYEGNWNPEPGGWRRMAAIFHNTHQTDLNIIPVVLGSGQLDTSFKIAHLTGTDKVNLSDAAKHEIQQYVQEGGTLVIDACGGNAAFAQSAAAQVAALFPNDKPEILPITSPLFAGEPKFESCDYRTMVRKVIGPVHAPRIKAITIKGRPAVLISDEDLSCGLVGMSMDGIFGYEPASATALMEKLILWAIH